MRSQTYLFFWMYLLYGLCPKYRLSLLKWLHRCVHIHSLLVLPYRSYLLFSAIIHSNLVADGLETHFYFYPMCIVCHLLLYPLIGICLHLFIQIYDSLDSVAMIYLLIDQFQVSHFCLIPKPKFLLILI